MKWNEYLIAFEAVLSGKNKTAPYDNDDYLEYVKLNSRRQNRWIKKMELSDGMLHSLNNLESRQKWILITEPWCGDAAHISPFINAMAESSPHIEFEIRLRDSAPLIIDQYLTNGGKAIPKLIVRDESGTDLFTWGPRPKESQELMFSLKETDLPEADKKAALQKWYNKDKGETIQREILELVNIHS